MFYLELLPEILWGGTAILLNEHLIKPFSHQPWIQRLTSFIYLPAMPKWFTVIPCQATAFEFTVDLSPVLDGDRRRFNSKKGLVFPMRWIVIPHWYQSVQIRRYPCSYGEIYEIVVGEKEYFPSGKFDLIRSNVEGSTRNCWRSRDFWKVKRQWVSVRCWRRVRRRNYKIGWSVGIISTNFRYWSVYNFVGWETFTACNRLLHVNEDEVVCHMNMLYRGHTFLDASDKLFSLQLASKKVHIKFW